MGEASQHSQIFIVTITAQACAYGKSHLHNLDLEDLVALTIKAVVMAWVHLAATN
ncbi:hypothetical protein D3C79_1106780 [compost metagenome]